MNARSHMSGLRLVAALWVSLSAFAACERNVEASSLLFKKITPPAINSGQVEEARRIVDSLYARWQQGVFEPVSNEFTPEMQKGLTPQLQEQSFKQIKGMFGDYQGLDFVEALTARFFLPRGLVYRFKGSYSRSSEQPEIRVVFDSAGKVSGLWLKPWHDELQ
jgi:hypothetical protein